MVHTYLRRSAGLLALAALVTVAAMPASAQRAQRVRFARGASEAQLETPRLARGASARYLVGVQSGQSLHAMTNQGDFETGCRLAVYAPGRAVRAANAAPSASGGRTALNEWDGVLSRSGDYQIVVTQTRAARTCDLWVTAE